MIDLHCHLLPGIDDGASDVAMSLTMARMLVADGVDTVACTPHILQRLYPNTGPQIRQCVTQLQTELDLAEIPLRLVPGADVHMVPDFISGLREGRLLSLGDTRYVLVEPPHHVAPVRYEEFFFTILVAGYVPILTHPERLTWVHAHYEAMIRLVKAGVWMQVTAGSLTGAFGRSAKSLGERMLKDGLVHILATDAHNPSVRPPELKRGRDAAARIVGEIEADHLVYTRPRGVIENSIASALPSIPALVGVSTGKGGRVKLHEDGGGACPEHKIGQQNETRGARGMLRDLSGRLRGIFD